MSENGSPPPPPKRRRHRKTLVDIDDNSSFPDRTDLDSPPKNKEKKTARFNIGEMSRRSLMNPFEGFGENRYEPTIEEDEEFRLTIEDMGKQKSFGIFRDVSPGE